MSDTNYTEATRRWQGLSKRQLGYLLIIPAVGLIAFVSIYPFLATIWYSVHRLRLNMPNEPHLFIGLDHYLKLFATPRFRNSLWLTSAFSVSWVTCQFLLGLGVALVLDMQFKGRAFIRAAVLVPWAMAYVMTALLWRWMYNPVFGFINAFLMQFGILSEPYNWLGTTSLSAAVSTLIVEVWQNTPFMALILLAGLQGIPAELYEAARIDGAGRLGCFWNITIPQLRHAILVALLFRSIDAFRSFDILYVLTQGGPGTSTEVMSLLSYRTLFQYLDFGRGSAVAVVMAIFTTGLSLIYIKVLSEQPEKEERV